MKKDIRITFAVMRKQDTYIAGNKRDIDSTAIQDYNNYLSKQKNAQIW